MNRNKGIKAALVILVVVCVVELIVTFSLASNLEDLRWELNDVRDQVYYQATLIKDLQEYGVKEELADYSFDIYPLDWEKGTITFEFTVTPENLSDSTRVVINNTLETVELERNGSSFVGTVDYPIDSNQYETSYHIYNGEVSEGSEIMDWIGAYMMAGKMSYVEFQGLTAYGNDKLTLAGNLTYYLNVDEKVENTRIIFKDEIIELGASKEGRTEINMSEEVTIDDENTCSDIYIEFVTDSGITYQVYPELCVDTTYSVGENYDKTVYLNQNSALVAITEDGTVYHMGYLY